MFEALFRAFRTAPAVRHPTAAADPQKELTAFLVAHHLGAAFAPALRRLYGANAVRVLERDPFRLARDQAGVDFARLDRFARSQGIRENTPARVEAGIHFALARLMAGRHAYVLRTDLVGSAVRLLRLPPLAVERAIRRMALFGDLVVEDEAIYEGAMFRAEAGVARQFQALTQNPLSRLAERDAEEWNRAITFVLRHSKSKLSRQERAACKRALASKISLLVTGPGAYASDALRMLVQLMNATDHTVVVCSLTGSAARDLHEVAGVPVETIPRLLGGQAELGSGRKAGRDQKNPIPGDLVIVDRADLLDLATAHALLRAIHPHSHLLLVGDPNRLPVSGPGAFFRDLFASRLLPVTRLDAPVQDESGVVANTRRILAGERLLARKGEGEFVIAKASDGEQAATRIVEFVTELLRGQSDVNRLEEVQVVSHLPTGPAGLNALNAALRSLLNPPNADKPEKRWKGQTWRVGDKVFQLREDHLKEVYAGEIGRIVALDARRRVIAVDFAGRRVKYAPDELDELGHAFAIPPWVVERQGHRIIVMAVVEEQAPAWDRYLLYAAVSGARERVLLVGTRRALTQVLKHHEAGERRSRLAARLRNGIRARQSAR